MQSFHDAMVFVGGKFQRCDVLFDTVIRVVGQDLTVQNPIQIPKNCFVVPGFVDTHIHGAGGADAMDGSEESLVTIAKTLAKEGTTTFLATTMTQSKQNILSALQAVKAYRETDRGEGARIAGVHLEGPFIAPQYKGAQPLSFIASPDLAAFDEYNEASGGCIKVVTLAPEVEGMDKLIAHLQEKRIVASVGHTAATSAQVGEAIEYGASRITHTFNAQSPLHHRELGVAGSSLLHDELSTELICDTIHVSVPAMRLLCKCKPSDKLILVTDAIRAKGLGDGESELGGQTVTVKDGQARLADGTLAGSVLKMNQAVCNLTQRVGVPLERAIEAATVNPACDLGIDGEVGSIAVGKRADFAVLDENFNVVMTIRDGEVIYQA